LATVERRFIEYPNVVFRKPELQEHKPEIREIISDFYPHPKQDVVQKTGKPYKSHMR
jgi:hypothetical protein